MRLVEMAEEKNPNEKLTHKKEIPDMDEEDEDNYPK